MVLDQIHEEVLLHIIDFLPQNDLCSLSLTCKKLNKLSSTKLYQNICITRLPVMRSSRWYIDSRFSYISSLRDAMVNDEINDYVIYLKVESLIQSLRNGKTSLVKNVTILDKVFRNEEDLKSLNELSNILKNAENIESLDIFDHRLQEVHFPQLKQIDLTTTDGHEIAIPEDKLSITIHAHQGLLKIMDPQNLRSVKSLTLHDAEIAGLRILKGFRDAGLNQPVELDRLSFSHFHGLHDYNTNLRELDAEVLNLCIDLRNVQELEMTIGCEVEDCGCLDTFLDELAPRFESLIKVSLMEKIFKKKHDLTEHWDVAINRFLLNIPTTSRLKSLIINHDTPLYGSIEDGVDGNYLRRKRLYETSLPYFTGLECLISNTLMSTVSCYEVLTSDLLWNGCECDYCKKFLPYFDEYLMNHAIYTERGARFIDMISPKLFGIVGIELLKRLPLDQISTLDFWRFAPVEKKWAFHGYDTITCFEDYDCLFDERFYEPLIICITHFLKPIIEVLTTQLPNLKTVVFSNIYFTLNDKGEIQCLYDNE
ncbi:hypothetical protein WICMUC_005460 [Wickerhamomyces mucosus]|uniref:F-box domain-containing protein n=1 Tax=Wickerhamomyces mucosus TaxID=1378264 RepID=A0A9P8T5K8_9ASCO|nr:hypothetical protein WICMUC_005460 [Wickerhamomyces mucosus]